MRELARFMLYLYIYTLFKSAVLGRANHQPVPHTARIRERVCTGFWEAINRRGADFAVRLLQININYIRLFYFKCTITRHCTTACLHLY